MTSSEIALGPVVGQGGEAIVYGVEGQTQELAKVYRVTPIDYEIKLAWMVGHPPLRSGTHVEMAWPTELLLDNSGSLQGFLMPRVAGGVPLLTVFNPRKRAQILPNFDLRYRYRAARNLAGAVQAAHDAGYVVGDLNESNALVSSTALITLLDTDSFQVRVPQGKSIRTFRSPVGKPEYTPPELQGLHFQSVDRTPAHDRFALGVLIYQLLMDGNHPFRLLWRGSGDPPSLEDSILQGWFPYAAAPSMVAPPPNAAGLRTLDTPLAALVRRCFIDGHRNPDLRPTAADWQRVLATAESALRMCNAGHIFAGKESACPSCAAQTRALRAKTKRKPHRSKRPKPTQTPVLSPPPPFSAPAKTVPAPTLVPAPNTRSKPPIRKSNWLGWLVIVMIAVWIWSLQNGGNATVSTGGSGAPRVTATARAPSVQTTRTPVPLNSAAGDSFRTWEFADPFTDASAFAPVNSADVTANIANDVFNLSVMTPGIYYWIESSEGPISSSEDFGAGVSIKQSAGGGEVFLRLLSQANGDQWFFAVNPGESSWLLYHDSSTSAEPFVWVTPRDITRLGKPQDIRVEMRNGVPAFLINGANVVPPSVKLPRIGGDIIVGFGIHATPELGETMEARFDDFRVYAI